MVEIRWTEQAADDLESIAEFIAHDSLHYARMFVADVMAAAERIAMFPDAGRSLPELNDPLLKEIILGNYRIVYRRFPQIVEILTVYHGARLIDPVRFIRN